MPSPLIDYDCVQDGGHWLWGHEMMAHQTPYEGAYTEWMNRYGPVYKIKGALFHPDIIVIGDQVTVRHILGKMTYAYVKSPIIRTLTERLVGKGLVWAEGNLHKRQRQELAPFFTAQATGNMFNNISVCASMGADNLEAHIINNTGNPKQGLTLDIVDWTESITLDITGRFALNYDFESGKGHAAKFIKQSWKKQSSTNLHWTAVLPESSVGRQKNTSRDLTDNRKPEPTFGTLHLLVPRAFQVKLSNEGQIESTKDELYDHVCTMIIAGQDTTASSLAFSLHQLAMYPGYQTRLRDEIFQLGREPTYDDLMSGMPWLDAIMMESFRHRPVVPHLERVATEDSVLRFGGAIQGSDGKKITEVLIKAGQAIIIPVMSINHMKSVWGDDADEFKPERWLDPARLELVNRKFGWNGILTFSDGPRQCIGYRMAVLTFKTTLATYIRKFEFHDTGAVMHARYVGTMQSYVAGEEGKGTQMPLRVTLVDDSGTN
ncbi:cytochrome P450 family protein [Rhizoctonia solani]|uniref:Cytochrome P450 family protein n=1 Tax=Rhizoctonia solani TaxID=456999 RepID=A0A8H8T116_9AGAM|nr:cytochrome P450 family protein [Rhizoctonia solani]QRW24894.1 cytochrome P450 family protein [Rhizoctonia solani]